MNETKQHVLVDDYRRETVFTGVVLVESSTKSARPKPQWVDITVWRTEGGQYVVRRVTRYNVYHSNDNCSKAEGNELYNLRELKNIPNDLFKCPRCVGRMPNNGAWGQLDRTNIEVYPTPRDLIDGLAHMNGTAGAANHSLFIQEMLADLSEIDSNIATVWMRRVVP